MKKALHLIFLAALLLSLMLPALPACGETGTDSVTPLTCSTQFVEGEKGVCCNPDEVRKMLDDQPGTAYYWLLWSSVYTDSIPEFTFTFANDTISGFAIRAGKLSSPEAYAAHARPHEIMLTIVSGNRTYYEILTLPDGYSLDYAEFPLSRTYEKVTEISLWYQSGYKGEGATRQYCYISDLRFTGVAQTGAPAAAVTNPVLQYQPIMPGSVSTQFINNADGQLCDPWDLANLLDDNTESGYCWGIDSELCRDGLPEFTFAFDENAIAGCWLRTGNLKSQAAYSQCARPRTLMLEITNNGNIYYETITLPDDFTANYVRCDFSRAYLQVTQISIWYKDAYRGLEDTADCCHITDIRFMGYQ